MKRKTLRNSNSLTLRICIKAFRTQVTKLYHRTGKLQKSFFKLMIKQTNFSLMCLIISLMSFSTVNYRTNIHTLDKIL